MNKFVNIFDSLFFKYKQKKKQEFRLNSVEMESKLSPRYQGRMVNLLHFFQFHQWSRGCITIKNSRVRDSRGSLLSTHPHDHRISSWYIFSQYSWLGANLLHISCTTQVVPHEQ